MEVSALVSCNSLYLPVCLTEFGSSGLFCDLDSLIDLRKVVDFQFAQLFLSVSMELITSKIFACQRFQNSLN